MKNSRKETLISTRKFRDKRLRELLKRYHGGLKELKRLGYIKNYKVVGELGEFFAIRILHLKKAGPNSKGFDAVDENNKKVQIKTRHRHEDNPKVYNFRPFNLEEKNFDYAIFVILDKDYWVDEMWRASFRVVNNHVVNKRFSLLEKTKKTRGVVKVYPLKKGT